LFDHFDFVVAIICVAVFQHHTVVIPSLVSICSLDTPQLICKKPQMEVASMLKSKDAMVPFRNFNFGNKWSLTTMEKATALPLQAGFMPNSPMPMLDVSNWLLLHQRARISEMSKKM
jgi:hypothetical protein